MTALPLQYLLTPLFPHHHLCLAVPLPQSHCPPTHPTRCHWHQHPKSNQTRRLHIQSQKTFCGITRHAKIPHLDSKPFTGLLFPTLSGPILLSNPFSLLAIPNTDLAHLPHGFTKDLPLPIILVKTYTF